MPYGVDDDNLPDHVKKMSDKKRAAWVKIWNSTYQRCTEGGGEDCEANAFKVANGMTKKMQLEGEEEGLELEYSPFFFDLAQLAAGKKFDAMVSGTFVDMLGRKVIFKAEELKTYVKNTVEAIAATKTESGEVVGLPIDAKGHDKGDGAGWIVDVALEDGKVRVTPKWTEIGQELIQKGIRRFFSPTVDTEYKVILGGSLTNWPATRNKRGVILLRPVELEAPDGLQVVNEFQEESIEEKTQRIRESFNRQFNESYAAMPDTGTWVMEVYEGSVIIRDGGKYYRAGYTYDEDGELQFSDRSEWSEVKRSWVEAAMDFVRHTLQRLESMLASDDFDTSDWDAGRATSGKEPAELAAVCLVNLNGYPGQDGDPVKGLFYLPYRYSGDAKPNKNAIRAIGAGARSMAQIKKPSDVPQDYFDGKMKAAANKVITWWKQAFENDAPEAIYKIAGKTKPAEQSQEVLQMDITKEELSQLVAGEVKAALSAGLQEAFNKPKEPGDQTQTFDILKFLEMEGMGDDFKAEVNKAMLEAYEQSKAQALKEAADMIASVRREAHVSDFTLRITGGTEDNPRGIVTNPADLKKFLLSLTPDQAEYIQPLLEKIVAGNGMVEFEELGHSKKKHGSTPLPEYYAVKLRSGELKVENLSDPLFGLGDLSAYDLSEWKK